MQHGTSRRKRTASARQAYDETDPLGPVLDKNRREALRFSGRASTSSRVGPDVQVDLSHLPVASEDYSPLDRDGEKRIYIGPARPLHSILEENASSTSRSKSVLSDFGDYLVECLGHRVIPALNQENQDFYMQRQAFTEFSRLIQEFLSEGEYYRSEGEEVNPKVEEILELMGTVVTNVTPQNRELLELAKSNRGRGIAGPLKKIMVARNSSLNKFQRAEGKKISVGTAEHEDMLTKNGGYIDDDLHGNDMEQNARAMKALLHNNEFSRLFIRVHDTLEYARQTGMRLLTLLEDYTGEPYQGALISIVDDSNKKNTVRVRLTQPTPS